MNQFEENYFEEIYSNFLIDGDYNFKNHIDYILSFFRLYEFKITSIYEIGFGNAKMLEYIAKKTKPNRIIALDISKFKTQELLKRKWIQKENIAIQNLDFLKTDTKYLENLPVDLLICNSVIQYVDDVEMFLKKISKISKFVYLTIPTDKDFIKLKTKLNFEDKYAKKRNNEFYRSLILKYFHIIGTNILQSKFHFKENLLNGELFFQ